MTTDNNRFQSYEEQLKKEMIERCSSFGLMSGELLAAEELNDMWNQLAPYYMVDAVPLVSDYPSVAIAWTGYIGMALASMWNVAWDQYSSKENLYDLLKEPRGFDEMDEYIIEEVLGLQLDSDLNKKIENTLRSCAHCAITMIRKEQIEPQSVEAFHLFAATTKIMFQIGVSLELYRLGYKYEKVTVSNPLKIIN